jgi:hypothetical protein
VKTLDNNMGAIITGIFTLSAAFLGAIFANWLNKKSEQRKEKTFEKSIIKSLEAELRTMWDLHKENLTIGIKSLKDEEMCLWQYTVRHDYFTIYHSNCVFISQIKNEELKNSIIRTYIKAKGFIESLLNYTEAFKRYDAEKEQMLKTLNMIFKYTVSQQDLELVLSPVLKIEAAFTNLNFNYENNNDVILNLNKIKSFILNLQQELVEDTKLLKDELIDLEKELLNCFDLIDNYLK